MGGVQIQNQNCTHSYLRQKMEWRDPGYPKDVQELGRIQLGALCHRDAICALKVVRLARGSLGNSVVDSVDIILHR